jgi:hypothetical protein
VAVYAAAPRAVAFRSDHEGITLGALPRNLSRRRRAAVFVPWADVYYQHAVPVCQGGPIGWERVGSARPHLPAVVASTLVLWPIPALSRRWLGLAPPRCKNARAASSNSRAGTGTR